MSKKVSGIYRITCVKPGWFFTSKYHYYGQSVSVYDRRNQHFQDLGKRCHANPYLQEFFNQMIADHKNIRSRMRWKLVKRCPVAHLEAWERYYIQYKRSELNIKRIPMAWHHYLIVFSWQITLLVLICLYLIWRLFL